MAFRENMAAGRKNPNAGPGQYLGGDASKESNQEQTQPASSKARSYSTSSNLNVGNLVAFTESTKGTGTAGVPVSAAYTSKARVMGEGFNPDGQVQRHADKFRS